MSEIIRAAIVASSIIAISILLAVAARYILRGIARGIDRRETPGLGPLVFRAMESPVMIFVVMLGIYGATLAFLRPGITDPPSEAMLVYRDTAVQVFRAILTVIVAFGVIRLANVVANWYAASVAPGDTVHQVTLFKKIVSIVAWALVVVLVLRQLGYEVSALLATLGIAGLAVALALQETLSNLFAGFYVMADKSIKVGDYIKLETGEEGFVEEVGWRNTRIRLWANNMVLIPNSKLIQTTLTNYEMPQHELSVYIWCGVSYSSDLDHVEAVTVDVAKQILQTAPGAVTDWTPAVRFKEFGDSNITFVVVLRAQDVASQYFMHHLFIKALHRRYREEGIEINYPVRVIVPAGDDRDSTPKGPVPV